MNNAWQHAGIKTYVYVTVQSLWGLGATRMNRCSLRDDLLSRTGTVNVKRVVVAGNNLLWSLRAARVLALPACMPLPCTHSRAPAAKHICMTAPLAGLQWPRPPIKDRASSSTLGFLTWPP